MKKGKGVIIISYILISYTLLVSFRGMIIALLGEEPNNTPFQQSIKVLYNQKGGNTIVS